MRTFDAWHLPALRADELALTTYELGDLVVRAPDLTPDQLRRVLDHITESRRRFLVPAATAELVSAISRAAARIADPATPDGAAAREFLTAVTGYSPETVTDILDHMTRDWSADSLRVLMAAELADPAMLEAPRHERRTRRHVFARGPRLAFHIFSGNVPGVAVTSIVRALLVRAATLGKTASGEPVLPVIFMQALTAVAPSLAECVAITYWPGGSEELEDVALRAAEAVIVYGGGDTVRAITPRVRSAARLIVHGPRLSIGIVGRAAHPDVAHAIARATAAYDQQGCVSPHVVYVEKGGVIQPRELARAIAHELAALQVSLPRRKLSHAEALAIRNARAQAEFRGIAGAETEVFASDDTSYTVIYDENATLVSSCLNRTLYVKVVADAEEIAAWLEPHRELLQSAALAGFSADRMPELVRAIAASGITRITTFEQLPWPPMWWHHDGRGPLQELLFWHDIEL